MNHQEKKTLNSGRSYGIRFSDDMLNTSDVFEYVDIDIEITKYKYICSLFISSVNKYIDKIRIYNNEFCLEDSVFYGVIDFIFDEYGKNYILEKNALFEIERKNYGVFKEYFITEMRKSFYEDVLFYSVFEQFYLDNEEQLRKDV